MKRADEFIRDKEFEYKKLWGDWKRKEKMQAFEEYADQKLRLHVVSNSVCKHSRWFKLKNTIIGTICLKCRYSKAK